MIIVASITLAIENPLTDPNSQRNKILSIVDILTTVFFSVEVIIKVIANGLIFNGKNSYLLNKWNIIDFIVVTVSIFALSMPESNAQFLKTIRLRRLFRPIRVISRNEGLKVSI